MKLRFLLLALLSVTILSACEDDEDRILADAEACINNATAANVDDCMAKVAGMNSADAFLIRCSAHFIRQGFTEQRLADAFRNIKSSSATGGVTPTTTALGYMVFDNAIANHNVATSLSDCEQSGATSLYRILKLVEVATSINDINVGNGGTPVDWTNPAAPQQMEDAINGFIGGGGSPADLGTMAISLREEFCVNPTNFVGTDVCTKLNQAYTAGAGNAANIGNAILNLLFVP